MTTPKHARDTDQGRYYTHPVTGEQLVSVTNALGEAMSKPALVPWAAKCTAEAAWRTLPRMVAAMRRTTDCRPTRPGPEWEQCGRCWHCLNREIKGEHKVVAERASNLGTRIHDLADAHLAGRPMPDDQEAAPYLAQYEQFLADFGVDLIRDVVASELTVADPGRGYAGTLDIILKLPLMYVDGRTSPADTRQAWLVDIKTSQTKPATAMYDERPLQLVALRSAREMWLPDGTVAPMVRGIAGTAVLNLRTTAYAFIPCPSGLKERKAWDAVLTTAHWRHSRPLEGTGPVDATGRPITVRAKRTKKEAA